MRIRTAALHASGIAALAVLPLLASCGSTSVSEPDWELCPKPVAAATISIRPTEVNLRVGFTLQLEVRSADARGEFDLCHDIRLTSSDPATVSISASAVVTGVSAGSAYIRASSLGVPKDSVLVRVVARGLGSVAITPVPASLLVGQTSKLGVEARDTDGNVTVPGSIKWRTEDAAIATVSDAGTLVALAEGTAVVTVELEGLTATARIPVRDEAPTRRFRQIALGFEHTCAIVGGGGIPEGSAYCWGNGLAGQLGVGAIGVARQPLRVVGGHTFTFIATGDNSTCALTTSGATYCWGAPPGAQLGDGVNVNPTVPTRILTTLTFQKLALGGGMLCGLAAEGAAYCWGRAPATPTTPALVPGGFRFVDITAGGGFVCGLTDVGRAYCWGSDYTWAGATPTPPRGDLLFSQINAGTYHVCGVAVGDGAGHCWGRMDSRPLGSTVPPATRETPIAIPGGLRFTSVSAGGGFTCGVTAAGSYCLGSSGFADNTTDSSPLAIPREPRQRFASITTGLMHSCAIDTRGGAWCWGMNLYGQAGVGEVNEDQPYQLVIR